MKQGQASQTGMAAGKVEPKSRAVSPAGADQLGQKVATVSGYKPLHVGRGYEAPKAANSVHHCGSQGKHR